MSHTMNHEGAAGDPEATRTHAPATVSGTVSGGAWERPRKAAPGGIAQVRFTPARPTWSATSTTPDGKRSRLRRLLTEVDIAAAHMRSSVDDAAMRELRVAVDALTDALDLGAEPRLASCRTCGRLGMAEATICGFCWTSRRPSV